MNAKMGLTAALALGAVLALSPLGAQDAAAPSSGDDVFNSDESVTTTTDQTQNAAPRNDLLKEAAPRITGTFTGTTGFAWNWSDIYNAPFNIASPTSSSLNQQGTELDVGFVALARHRHQLHK